MIYMPKAERLMYASQGLSALTDVLITNAILSDIAPHSCAIRDEHLEGYLRAIQCLALELERAISEAWESADNPAYLSDTDQEQAWQGIHGVSETVSTLTWTRIPTTKQTHREAAQ